MRKVPLKNYVWLLIVIVISVIGVLYFGNLYRTSTDDDSMLYSIIKEIKPVELEEYITENPSFIIYLSDKKDENIDFENRFQKFITDYDLQKNIVFMDIENFDAELYRNFYNKYSNNISLVELFDNIILIDNQIIVDVLYDEEKNFDIREVQSFFRKNGIY